MDLGKLEQKLIRAARAHVLQDHVPYAFEKRITARIRNNLPRRPDFLALWARALWRSAFGCMAVALALGAFTVLAPPHPTKPNLSEELEQTMLAAVDQDNSSLW